MRYSFLLKTPDADCFLTGRFRMDPASSELVGTIDLPEGTVKLSDITIVPGKSLSFDMRIGDKLVRHSFRPDPDAPRLPESTRELYTWWTGDCVDGSRRGSATCVLGQSATPSHKPAPKPTTRCAVLPATPQPVSIW